MSLYIGEDKITKVSIGASSGNGGGGLLQTKSVTPTENQQTITPDSGFDGLSSVLISAISPNYVGSNIVTRNNSGVTALNSTTTSVSFDAGYYPNSHGATVATAAHDNPSVSIGTDGVITATHIQTSGYVNGGTTTATLEMMTSPGFTITPMEGTMTIPTTNIYMLGNITIEGISTTYIGSGVNRLNATTYTPGPGSIQIPSGYYLNGAQTILGDANLKASNIKRGVTIFGVTGTLTSSSADYSGGTDFSAATATSGDMLLGTTAYTGAGLITGTITTNSLSDITVSGATVTIPSGYYATTMNKSVSTTTHGAPTISVSSTGLITATHAQTAGYVSADTKTKTQQLTTIGETTYTPGNDDITITSGKYITGTQTIEGDANLIAGNIKNGVSIFGVEGTFIGTATSGTDTSDATATSADMLYGKTAYVNNSKITGTIPTNSTSDISVSGNRVTVGSGYYASDVTRDLPKKDLSTPTISVNTTTGQINVSINQESGYTDGGIKQTWKILPTLSGRTITPTTTDVVLSSGNYLIGNQTIKGDANLLSENIKSGVTIFGVSGTLGSGGTSTDTTDATATAGDILLGKTAYVNNRKVTGTIETVNDTFGINRLTLDTYYGKVYANASINGGFVSTSLATQEILELPLYDGSSTFTPSKETQYLTDLKGKFITSSQYLSIAGDNNLIASNIKSGVSIFGVSGTYVGTTRTFTIKTWTN